MRLRLLTTAALTTLILSGCIKDKGNYEYAEISPLTVKFDNSSSTLTMGESKIFKVEVSFEDKHTSEFDYEWSITGEVVSTSEQFEFKATELGLFRCALTLTDRATGAKYMNTFNVRVAPLYEVGFMIVNDTELNFIRMEKINGTYKPVVNDTVIYTREYTNIFESANSTKIPGQDPQITEHWAKNDYGAVYGEVALTYTADNKRHILELSGETLKRETSIVQEFGGSGAPASLEIVKMVQTCWDSYLLDRSGVIYPRRQSKCEGYHLGRFDSEIKLWGGHSVFTDLIFTHYPSTSLILALETDPVTKKSNFVGIYANDYSYDYNNMRKKLVDDSGDDIMSHFTQLDEKVIASDYFSNSYTALLMQNAAGEQRLHIFEMEASSRSDANIYYSMKETTQSLFGSNSIKGLSTMKCGLDDQMVYLYDDHKIYYFNSAVYQKGVFATFADKKIVGIAVQGGNTRSSRSIEASIAVAFDDGSVEIYQIDNKDLTQPYRKIFTSSKNFGNIRQILFKVGNGNNFY